MDWGHLFFKFDGRINRAKFWIAALVYRGDLHIFAVLSYVTDQSGVFQAVSGIVNMVIFISGLAVGVKRLHDRDKSGWYLLLFYIVPGVLCGASLRGRRYHGGFLDHRGHPAGCSDSPSWSGRSSSWGACAAPSAPTVSALIR